MTDTVESATTESTKTVETTWIDPETGNKVITIERDGETYDFILGTSPDGTDIWQRVPYDAAHYGPVTDFATDFDHADPTYNPNAPEVWKDLREVGLSRRPLRPLRRHVDAVDARHRQRGRLRHREFHESRRHRQRRSPRRSSAAGTDRWRTADHQRSTVPQHRPPPVAPAVRAEADRTVGTRDPQLVPQDARRDG